MRSAYARLFAIALPLSITWEMLQAPAFTGLPRGWLAHAAICVVAAVGDTILVLALFAVGRGLFGGKQWVRPPRAGRYLTLVVAGIVVQAAIEWLAVDGFGLWGYEAGHPTLPLSGTGLLPILYAVVVVPLTFWLLARWQRSDAPPW